MKNFILKVKNQYKAAFESPLFINSFLISLLLLAVAFVINFYAGTYADASASNPVTDIILNNIRVFDVDGIFIYGAFFFWIFLLVFTFLQPYKIPFTLKAISLFIMIRSVFISLTHIAPFSPHVFINPKNAIDLFSFTSDLFFSGHTGMPFLVALIFWQYKFWRYLFIATAIFFGMIVLMGHIHYSIDVLSAFFITFGIYRMAELFFPKAKRMFDAEAVTN